MRIIATTIAAAALTMLATGADANSYRKPIQGCEGAISDRLGLEAVPANYKVKGVRSRASYKDIKFRVSAYDDASPVQRVVVSCRVKNSGEVLALEFADESLPNALATQ